jgi:hypothetical protein
LVQGCTTRHNEQYVSIHSNGEARPPKPYEIPASQKHPPSGRSARTERGSGTTGGETKGRGLPPGASPGAAGTCPHRARPTGASPVPRRESRIKNPEARRKYYGEHVHPGRPRRIYPSPARGNKIGRKPNMPARHRRGGRGPERRPPQSGPGAPACKAQASGRRHPP